MKRSNLARVSRLSTALPLLAAGLLLGGCPGFPGISIVPTVNNTDKTNGGAKFIGSSACRQCHSQISDWQLIHGHAHKLTRIEGHAPQFPAEGTRAGVPNPPDGFQWSDISYVIGGYTKKGRFIDANGYILTTGLTGKNTQWNLAFPPNGTTPGWAPYESTATKPKPYDASCFECHTTGPAKQNEDFPEFQENRPGFIGTWSEAGVQCEACHGPGSDHFTTVNGVVAIDKTKIFVDPNGAQSCKQCHNRPFDDQTGAILASGGYIQHHEQWPELKASGGHKDFACTDCHDPHRSVTYDRANAIRKNCTDCHADQSMAGHAGKVFTRGDYSETLTCESCHMPYATKSGASATTSVVGALGRMGDTRTHIFRISTAAVDYKKFFSDDGKQVLRDDQGQAAVTVDFVCLRCHNEAGVFQFRSAGDPPNEEIERAAEISLQIHNLP